MSDDAYDPFLHDPQAFEQMIAILEGEVSDDAPLPEAIEAARSAFVESLMDRQPGDEPYDWDTRIGEIEVYRLRRALAAAITASAKT